MKGRDIEQRMRLVVNDGDGVRWVGDELALWINDACGFVVMLRPDAVARNAEHTCVAGTKQSIVGMSPKGLRLLDVMRNSPNGRAVRLVDREVLDTQNPNWHAATQKSTITNYVFDNRDPTTFYTWPPAAAGAKLELLYAPEPVKITAADLDTVELSVPDIYMDPVLNYVLFRAYGKDAAFAKNMALAAGYRQAAAEALGAKIKADALFSPDLNSPGGSPSAATAAGGV
jgi:hypothetical protein